MDYSNETEIMNSGGMGRGGFGGLGGGTLLETLIAVGLLGDGFLGNRRKDDCCCPRPATCESVSEVDKDVLATANQTQHEICEATHDINSTIVAGNTNLGDKISNGYYAINDKLQSIAYAQQATAKDTQALIATTAKDTQLLIESKFAALEKSQLAAANCALEAEVNRYKTIEALKCCHGGK